MSTPMTTNETGRIVKTPETCWGHARVAGTRISVHHIMQSLFAGETPAKLHKRMSHITIEDIDAAQAYYRAHQEEIDQEIAEGAAIEAALRRQMPSLLEQKLAARQARHATLPPG